MPVDAVKAAIEYILKVNDLRLSSYPNGEIVLVDAFGREEQIENPDNG